MGEGSLRLAILSDICSFCLLIILLPALEEQLVASRRETEEAHLREFLLMEDHKWVVVVGI
jgi:N-acetylglutamate synthase-like GNAT family acetyltransferase